MSCGSNTHRMVIIIIEYYIAYLKDAQTVDIKCSYHI